MAAEADPRRTDPRDVVRNVGEGGVDVDELRRQGIEVDDDNEPAPENDEPTAPLVNNGRWEKPTMCPRRMANVANNKGKFISHRWENVAEMNEFDLFRMCFPEQFVLDVIIPQTNKNLSTPIDLHDEFYVWLGCIFYMACFQGIGDRDEWWSSSPIDQFKGAPFRLNVERVHVEDPIHRHHGCRPIHGQERAVAVRGQVPRGSADDQRIQRVLRAGVLAHLDQLPRRVDEHLAEQVLPGVHGLPPTRFHPVWISYLQGLDIFLRENSIVSVVP